MARTSGTAKFKTKNGSPSNRTRAAFSRSPPDVKPPISISESYQYSRTSQVTRQTHPLRGGKVTKQMASRVSPQSTPRSQLQGSDNRTPSSSVRGKFLTIIEYIYMLLNSLSIF